MADVISAKNFDRRAGIWGDNLKEDIDRRMNKRVQDFQSERNRHLVLRMVMAVDRDAEVPLTNDELSEWIDRAIGMI